MTGYQIALICIIGGCFALMLLALMGPPDAP